MRPTPLTSARVKGEYVCCDACGVLGESGAMLRRRNARERRFSEALLLDARCCAARSGGGAATRARTAPGATARSAIVEKQAPAALPT